jgi:hypothetical protein
MTSWIIGGVLCVAAYVIGRTRPLKRVRDWAAWEAQTTAFGPGWRSEAKALLLLALNPDLVIAAFWRKWRDRDKPPPEPVELKLSPWAQELADRAGTERSRTTPDAPKGGED